MSRIGIGILCEVVKTNLIAHIAVVDICHLIAYEYAVDHMFEWTVVETQEDVYGSMNLIEHKIKLSEFTKVETLFHCFPSNNTTRIVHNRKHPHIGSFLDFKKHRKSSTILLCRASVHADSIMIN